MSLRFPKWLKYFIYKKIFSVLPMYNLKLLPKDPDIIKTQYESKMVNLSPS